MGVTPTASYEPMRVHPVRTSLPVGEVKSSTMTRHLGLLTGSRSMLSALNSTGVSQVREVAEMPSILDTSMLIAAHAHGARLVTANVDDVKHLDGLIDILQA